MGFIDMWKADYQFKTLATSTLSVLFSLGFTIGSDMQSMLVLTAWTSAGIWLMIVIFTVKSILYMFAE